MELMDKLNSNAILEKYKKCCWFKDGAILFCVHRGKFTEGHNF